MPRLPWTLLRVPPLPGPDTMAVDAAVLEAAAARGEHRAIVRLYCWPAPTLSVGAKQVVPREVADRCRDAGVGIARRPTGGGAVLHKGDLTYMVVAPERSMGVLGIYRWVAGALVEGFAALGLEARVVEHGGRGRPLACFALATGADLEVGGRKICGSAQLRRGDWFLQHGSIPVEDVRAATAALLGLAGSDDSTCIQRERPGTGWDAAAAAFEAGFCTAWGEPADVRSLDERERGALRRVAAGLVPA